MKEFLNIPFSNRFYYNYITFIFTNAKKKEEVIVPHFSVLMQYNTKYTQLINAPLISLQIHFNYIYKYTSITFTNTLQLHLQIQFNFIYKYTSITFTNTLQLHL